MARPIVAGNWKMNTSLAVAKNLANRLRDTIGDMNGVDRVLCPPFPYLALVQEQTAGSSINIGAQNMSHEDKGAFTGEIAPAMVAELCDYVILGHSERRSLYGEADEIVNLKVKAALGLGLKPIICVGETLAQREAGDARPIIERQIAKALDGIDDAGNLVVAYEPVWAIGTGLPATPELAVEIMDDVILKKLRSLFGDPAALEVPLLYGGSVTPDSIQGFVEQSCIHGALVGGASLKPDDFTEIIRTVAQVKGIT